MDWRAELRKEPVEPLSALAFQPAPYGARLAGRLISARGEYRLRLGKKDGLHHPFLGGRRHGRVSCSFGSCAGSAWSMRIVFSPSSTYVPRGGAATNGKN